MERSKRSKKLLWETAEVFDLPADVVAQVPHVEVSGNGRLFLENHRGILSYSEEEIAVNGDGLVIRVLGEGLELESMTADALRIRGTILRIEWVV